MSGITEGYLFRKISSGDRISTEKNAHMVRSIQDDRVLDLQQCIRLASFSSSCSGTIYWTLALTPTHTALTRFDAVGASGCTPLADGDWSVFAIGVAGARSSPILLS